MLAIAQFHVTEHVQTKLRRRIGRVKVLADLARLNYRAARCWISDLGGKWLPGNVRVTRHVLAEFYTNCS